MRKAERRAVDLGDRDDRDGARSAEGGRTCDRPRREVLAPVRGEHHFTWVGGLDVEAPAMKRHRQAELAVLASTSTSGVPPASLSSIVRHQ